MGKTVVGAFYENSKGYIVKLISAYSKGQTTMFGYRDNDGRSGEITEADMKSWKHRADLRDFPNARDPLLPYIFDLNWDLKYKSDLERVLRDCKHAHLDEIRRTVVEERVPVAPALLKDRPPEEPIECGSAYMKNDGRVVVINALLRVEDDGRSIYNFYDDGYQYGEASEDEIRLWTLTLQMDSAVENDDDYPDPKF